MKTSVITSCLLAFMATMTSANPIPEDKGAVNADIPPATLVSLVGQMGTDGIFRQGVVPEDIQTRDLVYLRERAGPIVTVLGIAAIKGLAIITKIAVEIGAQTIKNLGSWNTAREAFTKKTVDEMWARNKDYNRYPAAICYNKAYHFQNGKWDGRVSAKMELGQLFTDYDCMYMEGGNQFYTHSDGGYVNLAYKYNNRCSHDAKTGDLTCR
ncbi:hypothetical protein FB567DRAFT_593577 [Paraphoma chrysanthemicola]|uniref:DUF7888 domain-containing protein n=1 Tax=Paraphoma chrysanthemicola TaxID=798071 RepID=A0A8K0VWR8_9PLEO|nr:hypothetical protein FB567DRAFT_593577 [Paraphoma chrysanthemicola]